MTLIGDHHRVASQVAQPSSFRFAADQSVQVRVIGPTRHGLSVSIGKETFQLNAPSKLAGAGTLTLQSTASTSASGQSTSVAGRQVKIIAQDDRPLSRPIEARLTSDVQGPKLSASTIVQSGVVKVAASPVSPEGKVLGPSIALHLQMPAVAPADSTVVKQSGAVSVDRLILGAHAMPRQAPAGIGRSGGSQTPPAHQPQAGAPNAKGSEPRIQSPMPANGGQTPKAASISAPPLTSSVSDNFTPLVIQRSAGDAQSRGDQARQPLTATVSMPPSEGGPTPLKSTTALATMNYKMGAAIETSSSTKGLHTADPQMVTGGREAISALVVGRTSKGNILVETQGQLMRIEQPIDLPPGTPLQVTSASSMFAWGAVGDRPATENRATLLSRLIGLLDDIDQAARQTIETDRQPATKQLPAPDRHLASRFLGLLASESGGDSLRGTLSSASERSGVVAAKGEQIQALVRELGGMASESLSDGWKSLTLPLGTDPNHAVSFYFRGHELDPDDEAPDGDVGSGAAKRALFDVSFSQIGRCQIDVLCQEQRFDFLIRSESSLRSEDRQDLANIFASACEIAGMKGEIGFGVGSFVEPARSPGGPTELRT